MGGHMGIELEPRGGCGEQEIIIIVPVHVVGTMFATDHVDHGC